MKAIQMLWSVAAVAAMALGGCGGGDNSTPSGGSAGGSGTPAAGGSAPAAEKVPVAFVTNNAAQFWTFAKAGCEKAQQDNPNVTVEFKTNADATAASQRRIIDDLMAKGIKGIAISPIDPENQTDMLNDVAKQAVLVTQDSDAPKSNRACYIGTDNHAAGLQAGELIKKALPGGGKIMVFVGNMGAQNAKDRYAGIEDALKDSNVSIIDVRTDGTDNVRAKTNANDTIVKYPDVACLVGLWDYNGPAILGAVKDLNKVGAIKIVCFDDQGDTLQGIKDGAIFGTVVQNPFQFGNKAVDLMYKVATGDKSVIPADKKIVVPTREITKDNIDAYMADVVKITGGK